MSIHISLVATSTMTRTLKSSIWRLRRLRVSLGTVNTWSGWNMSVMRCCRKSSQCATTMVVLSSSPFLFALNTRRRMVCTSSSTRICDPSCSISTRAVMAIRKSTWSRSLTYLRPMRCAYWNSCCNTVARCRGKSSHATSNWISCASSLT